MPAYIPVMDNRQRYPEVDEVANVTISDRRTVEYSYQFATIIARAMTQYTLKAGIEKFGARGSDAAAKELRQLTRAKHSTH